ncbi:hypothetical protein HMPREF9318_01236 [Streptococcus urinalis FB127-CNA-2]|uniref:TOBE domain protein n=1 Tax=Streptococcus urinalis 2285-97 TaxID=764291 RepID=G5KC84_9STRE|nr:ABC transporter ATP-binding protein [Streptococcus urinalis]EHJ56760.1 TOBE domain protein [Streptococcus urinalis 2285-97]EKS19714.1 hypothetical protein HMPREF9318_01236 [Streptococcus urinalis FB127-CNA-2]VEF31291.1 sugar ABC transporter ATPase [Streptococcus urinalis]
MGKEITLKNISKTYRTKPVLENINLTIGAGERVVLLGPSGSGKSTLLRMIAGLETITSGELHMGGELANDLDCGERDVSMVFQNYALYPHMTVSDNITFGLKANKIDKNTIENRLTEALETLGLTAFKNRYPKELSGGQRQRVALARALVKKSEYFLLDEPLSNLDVQLRLDARKELVKLHEKYGQTFVYVTHDQVEAMTLADRIVILNDGMIQMVDYPDVVYNKPANVFTATFIGSPGMSILNAEQDDGILKIGEQSMSLSDDWKNHLSEINDFYMGIRPEHIQISKNPSLLKGVVKYCELLGQHFAYTVAVGQENLIAFHDCNEFTIGQEVGLTFSTDKIHFFDKTTEKNLGYPKEI